MDSSIEKSLNHIKEIAERCKKKAPKVSYKCLACKDTGIIITNSINSQPIFTECKCRKTENLQRQWINAGFNILSNNNNFANFHTKTDAAKKMREMAIKYVNDFEGIRFLDNNSIAFLGQPGSGKTHLCMAIAAELIKKGFSVVYFPYRDIVTELKQNAMNSSEYQTKISRYKKATVVVIDDLFKGGITDADIRIVFEILNYRYLNKLSIIISSEIMSHRLLKIDEAIGSRIREMCKDKIIDIYGEQYNLRLAR